MFDWIKERRTCIKCLIVYNFGQIPPLTNELSATVCFNNQCRIF